MVFLCYPSLVFHFFYLTLTLGSKMWHRHLVYYMYCMQVNLYSWQYLVHPNRYSAPKLVSNFWNGQNSNFVGVSGANFDFMNITPSKLFKFWFWLISKSENGNLYCFWEAQISILVKISHSKLSISSFWNSNLGFDQFNMKHLPRNQSILVLRAQFFFNVVISRICNDFDWKL